MSLIRPHDAQPEPQPEPQPAAGHAADEETLAGAAAELDEVEAALARLEDGSFDRCQVCGAPIGRDRLLEDPLLTRCPHHAGGAIATAPSPVPGPG